MSREDNGAKGPRRSIVVTSWAAIACSLFYAVPAVAQDGGLSEIIVTARRTSENLQTAPIAVSSLSSDELATRNITNVAEIANATPNLSVLEAPSNGTGSIVYIRGIGAIDATASADPPTTIYVDGVVQARPTGNAFDLPDLDRVEVLRGPQGTLFGRNTTGGAIAIYTSKPTEEFSGKAEIGYGRFNELRASAVLNTGRLGNTPFKAKLTFQNRSRDGYVDTFGRDASNSAGYYRNRALSFTLEGDLSDVVTITNRTDYNYQTALPQYQMLFVNDAARSYWEQSPDLGGPPLFVSRTPMDKTDATFYIDPRRQFDPTAKAWSNTLNIQFDISPGLQIKSITGYRHLNQKQSGQIGGSALLGIVTSASDPVGTVQSVNPLTTPYDYVKQHQWSQELQATGELGDFTYAAGLYYFKEHATDDIQVLINVVNGTSTASSVYEQVRFFRFDSRSMAAYGQLNYRPKGLDGRLEISGGLRYTYDTKEILRQTRVNGTLIGPDNPKESWKNLGWSASASYRWTDQIMTYVRAASAYRAGGFNATQIGAAPFDPEKAIAIEAGIKSELFDRHLRLNATVFKTFYKDLQILQRDAVANSNLTTNAAKATYEGVELESVAQFGGFRVDGSLGYVNPKYKEYLFVDSSGPVNLADQARFPLVAKWTWNIGAQYASPPTGFGVITPRIDYAYRSSFYFQPVDTLSVNNALLKSGATKQLSAKLTFSELPFAKDAMKNLSIQFWGDNLTNNRTLQSAVDFGYGGMGAYSRPRSYGVRIMADF
ncbi:hypothetical protein MB02_14435 [Croceicoccus estronivorus]|uniref:TonB-dependent receptor n=1 Tax=Croceicoccus estronivorus TaxID=1172626 RepID=UPI00082DDFB8|nr:TonB-dependent receptor [Croceicoccus estronivorus]OCC22959.1 hypothetical protein MB02_14435 [Croceicoccus estronivorus]